MEVSFSDQAWEIDWEVGTYEWRPAEDRLVWSQGLLKIYGLATAPSDEAGFCCFLHPDDRVRVEAETSSYLESNASRYSHTFRIVRRDGSLRYILDRGSIERDLAGTPKVLRGINVDITALVEKLLSEALVPTNIQGEQAAKQLLPLLSPAAMPSDALAGAIVRDSFDAIISKNLEGIVVSWNAAAERIFGWNPQETIGRSIRTIIPPDRLHEEDTILAKIRAGEIVSKFETKRLHRDGREFPVSLTISPIFGANGSIIGASKIAHDASSTFELRSQLEKSEHQFRSLANSIPQLAWVADGEGSIFWYNTRWYEYTGTKPEDMMGWGWTSVHHPDHIERVRLRIQRSWDTGVTWEDTFPLRSKTGEYRWFLSRALPVYNQDGSVWRWFGTNTDVTDQRAYEEQLGILMGESNHRAKNLFGVIQAIVSRTADKEYAKTFGDRLRAISRNHELLTKRSWEGALLSDLIASQLEIVQDLLHTRITLHREFDVYVKPSAAEAIGLAIYELTTNALKHGSLSTERGTVAISTTSSQGDEGRTLILNWSERGGPLVPQERRSGFGSVVTDRNLRLGLRASIDASYAPEGLSWRLSVRLSDIMLQIPEPVTEVPAPTNQIVGSTPRALAAPSAERRIEPRTRVLIVDDDPSARYVMARALTRPGVDVQAAADRRGAEAILKSARVDLLVSEIQLPEGESGLVLATNARQYQPHMKVLFVTGYELPAIPNTQALRKPVRPEELVETVGELLGPIWQTPSEKTYAP